MALGTGILPKVLENMTFGLEIQFVADALKLLPGADPSWGKNQIVFQTCYAIWDKLVEQRIEPSAVAMKVLDKRGTLSEEELAYQSWVVDHDITIERDSVKTVDAG